MKADNDEKEMSPICMKQLQEDATTLTMNSEQRELMKMLGLDSNVYQGEAMIEQRYQFLDQAATATAEEQQAQHALPVTLDDRRGEDVLIGGHSEWQDYDIQMTLDSGCCRHVLPADAAAGYEVADSPLSRRGAGFVVGNGASIPNEGQVSLNLEANTGSGTEQINSVFQVAELNRPLMSVSQICSHGHKCVFERGHATIFTSDGQPICMFEEDGGGLYVATMRLKAPSSFPRPER